MPVDYVLKRADIIAEARKWLDVPYKHQGRSKFGIDCVGLPFMVAKGLGHPVLAPAGYPNMPQGYQLLLPAEKQLWTPVRQTVAPGDLGVFFGSNPDEPQHFAFIASHSGQLTLIHSFSKYGKVVEQSWNRLWASKFHKLFVLPGTEEPV